MKTNLPVTQQETPYPAGHYLTSRTDLRGIVTYANDAFVEVSGYARDELIGQSHNIVRHPDMPPQAFADLWRTLGAGLPWRGIVKNRAKNGNHYWVEAFVVPVFENARPVGYMSVRSQPSRAAIAQAEASYQRLRKTGASFDSRPPFWQRLTIRARLLAVIAVMAVMMACGGAIGVIGIGLSNSALESCYRASLEPIAAIGRITALMADNRAQVMLSLQHDSKNTFSALHEHPVTMHTDAIVKNRDEISALIGEMGKRPLDAGLAGLMERYRLAREVFVAQGLTPARQAILDQQFDQANDILLKKINPAYNQAVAAANEVQEALKKVARDDFAAAEERYRKVLTLAIGGTALALLLVGVAAFSLLRSIVKPLRQVVSHFDRISQGDLTECIDISGRDETGKVLTKLASMQVHLKVMLDEIQNAAKVIEQQSMRVQWQTANVMDQSEQQSDRAISVVAATEEFAQSIREVADAAGATANAAEQAELQVRTAQASMAESSDATARVVNAVQSSSRTISDLNQSIEKIGDISQVIKEIADQTNLLALNAAIEAARAGEMGRGFAVVADEVRKLAERTSKSTTDITATVADVRRVADTAVVSMDHAVSEVEQGIGLIRDSVTGLNHVTRSSREVTGMARHIANAAREQSAASELVASNMERIAGLIDGNLESVRETQHATESLNGAAGELRRVVGQFKVIEQGS